MRIRSSILINTSSQMYRILRAFFVVEVAFDVVHLLAFSGSKTPLTVADFDGKTL